MLKRLLEQISNTDWQDLPAVDAANRGLLECLHNDRRQLLNLVDSAMNTPELSAQCEHFKTKDKLVLYRHASGWRLRMHIFPAGYQDQPHDHRWNFTSIILHGGYTHTLYEFDEVVTGEPVDLRKLPVRLVRHEREGDAYTLHHSAFHTVACSALTVSLLVRGPSAKDTSIVTDRATGRANTYFGAAQEKAAKREDKRMSPQRMRQCRSMLAEAGVFA